MREPPRPWEKIMRGHRGVVVGWVGSVGVVGGEEEGEPGGGRRGVFFVAGMEVW